ncbi:MAG: acyl-CoA dehydrogenase C-terminal domain-containing protein [Actinobacteria bacterium]|nr:acyl-CoA dehydrogenase C-terminal domain-containing protein [Actinomycetota bacterium]MBU1494210.1 acyl-CoA dehydrogenase C-terminal domain-containing protein [Actinomycetota bacterium]MBU1865796.1 acyl-CoA dehydrogenase C-terminal domain-containing protein [Actinomycetota bacterium]
MTDYRPPLTDILFVLNEVAGLPEIATFAAYPNADPEFVAGALGEAGRFAAEVIAPLNQVGDETHSTITKGAVTTPPGFKAAYDAFVASGWPAMGFPEQYGGGGMPVVAATAVNEMVTTANMAFSLCPMLTYGANEMLLWHGSEEQRAAYLGKLVPGEWTSTMVLTEADAGSDVGALITKAVPQGDGTYRVTGNKIFITWGDHDLTDNIVHIVLARTPDAPRGTKGISCFIIPKFLVNDDGTVGASNNVETVSLEHKLGIHASPTAVLAFEDSVGYLIGEENQGMRYMFTMMNNARLQVGLQGVSVAERAYQAAVEYATERRQGRAIGAPKTEKSPIVEHPDVRRMLLLMRSQIEAGRCLVLKTAEAIDVSHHHPDEAVRTRAAERLALLTPISKAWPTDMGVEVTSLGIQVLGGMGYIEESGMPQHFRDARITPIYEGTNGIQAADLVARKLPMRGGEAVREMLEEMGEVAAFLGKIDDLADIGTALGDAIGALAEASMGLGKMLMDDPNDALAGATPYQEMFGLTAGGWLLGMSALAAHRLLESGDDRFLRDKIATVRFFARHLLPKVRGLLPSALAGAEGLFAIATEDL